MAFGGESGNCPFCNVYVRFEQRQGFGAQNDSGGPIATVLTAICPNCQNVVVFVIRPDGWRRFPPSQPGDVPGTPPRVAEAFREAQLAADAGAPHAAAVMLRRTVASACTEQKIADRDKDGRFVPLNARIEQLRDHLLPVTYAAARNAKLLGDAGAHEEAEEEFGPVEDAVVRETIAVVRYILSNLYEIPEEVRALAQNLSLPGDTEPAAGS